MGVNSAVDIFKALPTDSSTSPRWQADSLARGWIREIYNAVETQEDASRDRYNYENKPEWGEEFQKTTDSKTVTYVESTDTLIGHRMLGV